MKKKKIITLVVSAVLLIVIALPPVTLLYWLPAKEEPLPDAEQSEETAGDLSNRVLPEDNSETSAETEHTENIKYTESTDQTLSGYIDTQENIIDPEKLYGDWIPRKAVEIETNEEVRLENIFGSSYSSYGGKLVLNSDGTFAFWMGAGINNAGTYVLNNGMIEVSYTERNGKFSYGMYDGDIVTIIVPWDNYNIFFEKE